MNGAHHLEKIGPDRIRLLQFCHFQDQTHRTPSRVKQEIIIKTNVVYVYMSPSLGSYSERTT